jgi:hypothetical protein
VARRVTARASGSVPYGMFSDFGGYLSVLPPYRYDSTEGLLRDLDDHVIWTPVPPPAD